MADITRRRVGELVRGVFSILLDHPEGLPAKEVLSRLELSVPPTEFEKSDYPRHPGVRRYEKTVRFATIPAVKGGWLLKSKGKWTVTDEGKAALKKYKDPEEFERKATELYRTWAAEQPDSLEASEEAPAESPATTLEEAEELAWNEIEKHLRAMNPYDLQNLVAALLRAMGYHVSWVSPPGPDKGIDILAHTDPLGTSSPRIKVQVKRHENAVTADGLRSFMALLSDQDVGIFVSTGGFTSAAEQEARRQEKRRITLLDMGKLFDLWVQHYAKLAESDKRLLPLKPVHYIAPLE